TRTSPLGLAVALISLAFPVRFASAGATAPSPVLAAASGAAAGSTRAVVLDGAFDFHNAVQTGTGLQLVIFQGTRFVRYPLGGAPLTGTSALLADGVLGQSDLNSFLGAGSTTDASV